MNQQTLVNRVEILEQKVEGLAGLPDHVAALELQILEFRAEVRVEFSAVRTEMRECEGRLRLDMDGLRGEMRELNQDARTHMLVLHEEVISRIALLDEHKKARQGPPRAAGRKPRHKKIKR